jgi:hypothetical protein
MRLYLAVAGSETEFMETCLPLNTDEGSPSQQRHGFRIAEPYRTSKRLNKFISLTCAFFSQVTNPMHSMRRSIPI